MFPYINRLLIPNILKLDKQARIQAAWARFRVEAQVQSCSLSYWDEKTAQ